MADTQTSQYSATYIHQQSVRRGHTKNTVCNYGHNPNLAVYNEWTVLQVRCFFVESGYSLFTKSKRKPVR